MCFSTNYYGFDHFEATVAVNLTAFLVIATMFISIFKEYVPILSFVQKSNVHFVINYEFLFQIIRLPRTPSIKIIDAWLIFTLFMPFLEVVLHTRIAMVRQKLDTIAKTDLDCKKAWVSKEEKEDEKQRCLRTLR